MELVSTAGNWGSIRCEPAEESAQCTSELSTGIREGAYIYQLQPHWLGVAPVGLTSPDFQARQSPSRGKSCGGQLSQRASTCSKLVVTVMAECQVGWKAERTVPRGF